MAVRDPDEISATAFIRFSELMADMGWTEKDAIEELLNEIAAPLGLGKKAVEKWFERQSIPGGHIFNVSTTLGVSAEWIAGFTNIEKADAIRPGLYKRDMRQRTRRTQKRAKQ